MTTSQTSTNKNSKGFAEEEQGPITELPQMLLRSEFILIIEFQFEDYFLILIRKRTLDNVNIIKT